MSNTISQGDSLQSLRADLLHVREEVSAIKHSSIVLRKDNADLERKVDNWKQRYIGAVLSTWTETDNVEIDSFIDAINNTFS